MGGDTGTAQEQQDGTPGPGLPYEQMWRRLRESLENIDGHLQEFLAADLKRPDKTATQMHGAEHYSVTGVLGYMDLLEVQAASPAGIPEPGKI